MLTDPKFWTAAEAATIARVSKMTVYRLLHSGELESIRIGRSFRIPETALTAYLKLNPTQPSSTGNGNAPTQDSAARAHATTTATSKAPPAATTTPSPTKPQPAPSPSS